jgi:hypothetical protein
MHSSQEPNILQLCHKNKVLKALELTLFKVNFDFKIWLF